MQDGATTYTEVFLLVQVSVDIGCAIGRILDAMTAEGVSGAAIKVRQGWDNRYGEVLKTVTTDENGMYKISDSSLLGWYTMECVKEGYITGWKNIVIGGVDQAAQDLSISPDLNGEDEYRIVLSWRDLPDDLDSHLTGPATEGDESVDDARFHVYFSNDRYGDLVDLDWDNTDIVNNPDPETITIHQQADGVYRYSVHDYTNGDDPDSMDLTRSNATVTVYKGSAEVAKFSVPQNVSGTIWTVFELSGNTIIPINTVKTGNASDESLY